MSAITKRYDDAVQEMADLLYGSGVEIRKSNPDGADLHVARAKKERKQARIGLATNVVGIGAGLAATPAAFKGAKQAMKDYRAPRPEPRHAKPHPTTRVGSLKSVQRAKKVLGNKKVAVGLAVGGAGLQVGNLAGDAIANRVLSREANKNPDIKGGAQTAVRHADEKTKNYIHKSLTPLPEYDIKWEGEFSKVNDDLQQVFGWASIVEKDGEKIVDLQGDYIAIEEVEKSAYEYVHKSRKGGDMHLKDDFGSPVSKSHMIESFVVTPEKKQALGLPESAPTGWWVGYQINDPELWAKVKSGERTGFSIHGRGIRTPAST